MTAQYVTMRLHCCIWPALSCTLFACRYAASDPLWPLSRFSFLLPKDKRQDALVATSKALVGGCLWSLGFQKRTWKRAEGFEYDAEHTALAKASPDAIPGAPSSHDRVRWGPQPCAERP